MAYTFDRYLLKCYLQIYLMLFVTTFGLFVIIDGFTNIDGFQDGQPDTLSVLMNMLGYYAYQSSLFFDRVGSTLSIVSVMVVFALLYRNSEIQPMLAAGVPTYRLIVPVILGTVLTSAVLSANQELVIPRIAHHLQSSRSEHRGDVQKVEPVYDWSTGIHISGGALQLGARRLEYARFSLPSPEIAREFTTLRAREATYYSASKEQSKEHPAGWLLADVSPKWEQIGLTDEGRKQVLATNKPNKVFVVTDVSFDQLSNRSSTHKYVSTPELIRRIRNPAYGIVSARGQALHVHSRLLRPLLDMIAVLIAVPLIVRRESVGLVGNMAICALVLGALFGVTQASNYLGAVNLISVDLAAWIPAFVSGTLAAWLSGIIQT